MVTTQILVVENEGIVRKDISERLAWLGYSVQAAVATGEEALRRAAERKPDLALMDIMLTGDLDGISCAREMRDKFGVPVVYLTAFADQGTLERAKVTEPFGYILKPFEERDLQSVIEMAIYKHRMERRLRESEEKYRTLVEAASEYIFSLDTGGTLLFVNSAAAAGLFGGEAEGIIGRSVFELLPQDTSAMLMRHVAEVCSTGSGRAAEEETAADGERRWFSLSVQPLKHHSKSMTIAMVIASDITGRKRAELALAESYRKLKETQEQLIQSSKMTAMGQMAAGISHELNQPLTGIKGFTQTAMLDLDPESRVYRDLATVVKQCERMESIIGSVRSFARRSPQVTEPVDVNRIIEETLLLIKAQLHLHNIRVVLFLDRDLPKVNGNGNQLQQVFVNMITNARDAIESAKRPSGGDIRILSRRCQDGMVEVVIQDDGVGISTDNRERLFEPFFTTKSIGSGLGLGLSIVYGIIESHKGRISFDSSENNGSSFRIVLPSVS